MNYALAQTAFCGSTNDFLGSMNDFRGSTNDFWGSTNDFHGSTNNFGGSTNDFHVSTNVSTFTPYSCRRSLTHESQKASFGSQTSTATSTL